MDLSNDNKVKDIPDIPNGIINGASKGKLVLFIGAGVSRIIGCPSWEELALNQLRYLYKEAKVINFREFKHLESLEARKLLSICRNICKEKNIAPKRLESQLRSNPDLSKRITIFADLYKFNAIYVTTNYDDNLAKIARTPSQLSVSISDTPFPATEEKVKSEVVFFSKDEHLIANLSNGKVIYLHGSQDDEANVVMTINDYMKLYERDSKTAVLLEKIFNDYTVLFVGYGLEEYEVLEFVISKSKIAEKEVRHFMLYPAFQADANLLDFYRKYYADLGIELIPYPLDNGYEHLATVVNEWAKQIEKISRPQDYWSRVTLIDEVL